MCVYLYIRLYSSCNDILNDMFNSFSSQNRVGNRSNRTPDLTRHNYRAGKLWCFWASYTVGAVVALSGECLGAADGTTWSCPRSTDILMCEWVRLVQLLKDWIKGEARNWYWDLQVLYTSDLTKQRGREKLCLHLKGLIAEGNEELLSIAGNVCCISRKI